MIKISLPTEQQLSPASLTLLEHIKKRLGKIPNLDVVIGYSAFALKAFIEFEENLNKGSFSPKEREAIALIVSEVNDCKYCLAAHTLAAIKTGFTQAETITIRKAQVDDFRLHAIVRLAKSMAENKGVVSDFLLENFYTAGFKEAALMELTGLVAMRTFTNYVFALTDIPIDYPEADPIK